MKKKSFTSVACLLLSGSMLVSCVGSFRLFNKLATWNKQATGNKFLNELIFILISPAYAVCGVADVLVLNTIEFWSGKNPVRADIGKTRQVEGSDGLMYAVKTLEDGYEITSPDGKISYFRYDKKTDTWSVEGNGVSRELFKFNEDGTIHAYLPDGRSMDVSRDGAGVYTLRMAVNCGTCYALWQ